ncbi:zinc finger domain-containing protein [Arthrobacter woluwensis]|uniref:zinc finger domain-containing protein n=1 Tax=Arthrobacter woluwensis TaxID=156980 RepID=UPI00382925B9
MWVSDTDFGPIDDEGYALTHEEHVGITRDPTAALMVLVDRWSPEGEASLTFTVENEGESRVLQFLAEPERWGVIMHGFRDGLDWERGLGAEEISAHLSDTPIGEFLSAEDRVTAAQCAWELARSAYEAATAKRQREFSLARNEDNLTWYRISKLTGVSEHQVKSIGMAASMPDGSLPDVVENEQALRISCDYCGAEPGEFCRRGGRTVVARVHRQRQTRYRELLKTRLWTARVVVDQPELGLKADDVVMCRWNHDKMMPEVIAADVGSAMGFSVHPNVVELIAFS